MAGALREAPVFHRPSRRREEKRMSDFAFIDLLRAISYASRQHRHQVRNRDPVENPDGTPYVSHPIRVMTVLRHVFGVDDPVLLTAAVLHDTIEDTETDYDELIDEGFAPESVEMVAALTKDKSLQEGPREEAYRAKLVAGGPEVMLLKLADAYDNVIDASLHPEQGKLSKAIRKAHEFLEACRDPVEVSYPGVMAKVEKLLEDVEA
jgi:guanosine-3',5'-bis(diphosphate) 3'-pyrophosphohydrolase